MLAVFAALAASLGGAALMPQSVPPEARLLGSYIPTSAGPWLAEADRIYDAASIFDYIDGAGEVYRSYNMRLLVARRFHKDGRPDLVVDAFDMGTSEDAFGAFTHDLDGREAGIGQGSTYQAGLLLFWKGRYFVSIYAEEETEETKALVLELGRAVAEAIPEEGPKPRLLKLLPPQGLEADRIRFFHNHSVLNYHFFVADTDILLLRGTAKAALADYGRGAAASRLLVVEYADADEAARAGASFAGAYMPGAAGRGLSRMKNGRWTGLMVHGRYLAVVFDAATGPEASSRLEAVKALIEAGAWRGGATGRAVRLHGGEEE